MTPLELTSRFVATLLFVIVVVVVRIRVTRDLPPCPHSTLPVQLARPSGCIGHRPDPIRISELKNGDILLLSYRGIRSKFSAAAYGSVWNHTGVVVLDPKTSEPFVFEAAGYYPPYNTDIVKIPICKWAVVNKNADAIAIVRINKGIPEAQMEKTLKSFDFRNLFKVGDIGWSWLRFLFQKPCKNLNRPSFSYPVSHWKRENRESVKWREMAGKIEITCHELTIAVLQDAGVIEKVLTPCSYLPNALYNISDLPFMPGYWYCAPMSVSFEFSRNTDIY